MGLSYRRGNGFRNIGAEMCPEINGSTESIGPTGLTGPIGLRWLTGSTGGTEWADSGGSTR